MSSDSSCRLWYKTPSNSVHCALISVNTATQIWYHQLSVIWWWLGWPERVTFKNMKIWKKSNGENINNNMKTTEDGSTDRDSWPRQNEFLISIWRGGRYCDQTNNRNVQQIKNTWWLAVALRAQTDGLAALSGIKENWSSSKFNEINFTDSQ